MTPTLGIFARSFGDVLAGFSASAATVTAAEGSTTTFKMAPSSVVQWRMPASEASQTGARACRRMAKLRSPSAVRKRGRAFWEPIRERLRARRALLMAAFDDMGFTYGFPGGSYFIFPNIARLGVEADAFCLALLREGRVLAFPGSQSGDLSGEYIRVSYLQPRSRLREAVARMRRVIASL